jgi:murein DD-endopeptidase MepM/ murein hydrolase activator NlpD
LRTGPLPTIEIGSNLPGIGRRTEIEVVLSESTRGLSGYRIELTQRDQTRLLQQGQFTPREAWRFWGEMTSRERLTVVVGNDVIEDLKEGEAVIRATADRAGTWLRHPDAAVKELVLPVRLVPPSLQVISSQHYLTNGGCEVVVYNVGESAVVDGVQVGEHWFPGYELEGGRAGQRFALFAAPFDLTDSKEVRLVAVDNVENRRELRFVDRLNLKSVSTDTIRVSDSFMEKVVPEILAATPSFTDRGSLIDNYVAINRELRLQNSQRLSGLAAATATRFTWNRRFQSMPNAQVMSSFADRRTYVYMGEEVDRQVHLGFDLASVRQAEVPAANSGIVLLAEYLGIYGNAVVLDHGLGLMSLYGHLSSIEVAKGESVEAGATIGRTGATGLAGGDHLHFTMLLRGVAVNPLEWWDHGWIRDRLARKLGPILNYQS